MTRKSKRVRTGCLTCRQRHLKCDEAVPDCANCRRSNRRCRRGLRLNFLDTMVHIPSCLASSRDWAVNFLDESRHIASEYRGGLKRYGDCVGHEAHSPDKSTAMDSALARDSMQGEPQNCPGLAASVYGSRYGDSPQTGQGASMHTWAHAGALACPVQSGHGLARAGNAPCPRPNNSVRGDTRQHTCEPGAVSCAESLTGQTVVGSRSHSHGADDVSRGAHVGPVQGGFIGTHDELDYMQAFVDGVGVWMDSLDHDNYFSHVVPHRALDSPLLLSALLACGAKHLSLANPKLQIRAECYYNTATLHLMRSLQNRDRDASECTAVSVILCVYEAMSDKPARDMSHIAGARALIRECGWDARSTGAGSACFWLSVGIEVLCCLAMNWPMTWDPDQWGLDMGWIGGDEDTELGQDVWVHRILYIVAKAAKFRASKPLFIPSDPHDQQTRLGARLAEWQALKRLCDNWNNRCPRSMHPVGYLHLHQTESESSFPKFWLTRNSALLGRLFYHTAQCILTQTNPMESGRLSEEMKALQLHHARQVLGIVASSRDRRMFSMVVQAAAIASAALVDGPEQMEARKVLDSIESRHGRYMHIAIPS